MMLMLDSMFLFRLKFLEGLVKETSKLKNIQATFEVLKYLSHRHALNMNHVEHSMFQYQYSTPRFLTK
jgi:hypothetical protein